MRLPSSVIAFALAAACSIAALAQQPRVIPGPQPDQTILLPNGWTISPAGQQIPLSTLPMSLALSPDGNFLLALNAGFLPPSISVIDLKSMQETARVPVEDAWLGLTFHPAGKKVYVGGATTAAVYEFNFQDGILKPGRVFPVVAADKRRQTDFIGDVALSADGRFLYAANLFRDSITVMNTQTGFIVREIRTGHRPYRILPNHDGETFFVSHWAEASVGLYRMADGQLIERIAVGPHPTDLVISNRTIETPEGHPPIVARLFVASAHTNHIESVGITDGNRFPPLERIPISPTPGAPLGSLPTALALSADGDRLYVVASGNNAIIMADISAARAELIAAIPTGWFPTAVTELPGGGLAYLSAKGGGSRPNPNGPDPTRRGVNSDYVAALETGSLGILPPLTPEMLVPLIRRVIANSPYSDTLLTLAGVPPGNPVPNRQDDPSPIEHVIYVIKENRSFDQIFGDFAHGDAAAGQKDLVVFNNDVTPNHRKLAREFALLDNFYAAGSVSADGYSWSTGALANDYVEKLWPSYQARRRDVYDFEGSEPAAIPPAGYLWTNALSAGLSVRNYGMGATRGRAGRTEFSDPGLAPHSQPDYPPFDLNIPDTQRVDVFLKDFSERQASRTLPKLMLVRLPADHTAGREAGKRTARAMVADNDYALGRLVEAVSKSAAWAKTAIFIVEDDAQDGADHIDAHRAPAFVVSPYSRDRGTDSTFYSSPSVLRTIELILGLRPMTQFDAAALPLFRSFGNEADPRPYQAVTPAVDLNERNPDGAGGRSRRVQLHAPPTAAPSGPLAGPPTGVLAGGAL
ncbi:MAG: bifunctional YncE family protein/alkaline phosphatase family protein [Acidobacteria bacterium]|nr:bifunctional YncE family protein/alkaline phosphatase family protein [Acidobacteriota bacterium]